MLCLNNPEFINTCEAYSRMGYWMSDWLIIPYIGIQLLPDSPISKKICFIDYSYVVFKDIFEIAAGDRWKQIFINEDNRADNLTVDEHIMIGCWQHQVGTEWRIQCKSFDLFVPDGYQQKERQEFVPYEVATYKRNMEEAKLDAFYNVENIRRLFSEMQQSK
ncbi:hypothetical protein [Chitinophaga sp. Cy-1792]|uniref:hypothetical protein n=1 Tax=Chitinophaga sp. Cy-1792 TaxID=2608339 RepID=UPI00141DE774|nr:hypothetical protein [Chitinophaga sp. Cy-1792]NIG55391.1 hypothetical protein [Chitinophaga sp. Cy-1792]